MFSVGGRIMSNFFFFVLFLFSLISKWMYFLYLEKKVKISNFLKIHNHNTPKLLFNEIYKACLGFSYPCFLKNKK